MKHHLKAKNLMLVSLIFITQESHGALPDLDLGAIRQQMEASKAVYLEKKEHLEADHQKAQQDFEKLQEKSATESDKLFKKIQDKSSKKEDIQQNIEALKTQIKAFNIAKLALLNEKRQILKEKHQENHRLRQVLLKTKRFYGEKLKQLYTKG